MNEYEQPTFKLSVTIRGPEETTETTYGPRTNRETLATLDIPLDPAVTWKVYTEVLATILAPQPFSVEVG